MAACGIKVRLVPCQVALQSAGWYARFAKLTRRPSCWRKALNCVALSFSSVSNGCESHRFPCPGAALESLNSIHRTEYIFDNAPLSRIKGRLILGVLSRHFSKHDRSERVATLPHLAYCRVLRCDHLGNGVTNTTVIFLPLSYSKFRTSSSGV